MAKVIQQLIDGQWRDSRSKELLEITDPTTQGILALVPKATPEEIEAAVAGARNAFLSWREVPLPERARLMLRYQHLLKEHHDELAQILAGDTGKTLADARGEVWRGIEVVEQAANVASLMMGETVENVVQGIDTVSWVQPLGVCAGITPFNFPAMIPLWMFPLAIACGNSFILKPSEQDPLTTIRLAELFLEAGAPAGVLQLIHGGREQVDALLEHPDVRAVSFVGSAAVAQHVYRTASSHLKRVQALAGAKNHLVALPDAHKDQLIGNLVGASCGAAGQRCMAISAAVFVGEARDWIPELAARMAELRPGHWRDTQAAYGPLISRAARERVLRLIAEGKAEGAECLLDGSQCTVEGYPAGNWLGPTLFRGVTTEMGLYREEIFGPVLICLEVDTLDQAIALVNANPYGNGTSLFTHSGGAARHFQHAMEVGQIGINVPIPVPLPFFSFTGWKGSFYGDLHAYGKQAVRFYSETKTVTSRWFEEAPVAAPCPAGSALTGPNLTIQLK